MPRDRDDETTAGDDPTIEEFSLVGVPGHLLRLCQQRAVDLFAEEVGEGGPTPRQFAIMLSVHQNPGTNQTGLVRISGIDRSTLTEILRRLVARDLMRRERVSSDQRTNALYLTPRGVESLRRALPGVVRAQRRILDPLPAAQHDQMMAALGILAGVTDGSAGDGE